MPCRGFFTAPPLCAFIEWARINGKGAVPNALKKHLTPPFFNARFINFAEDSIPAPLSIGALCQSWSINSSCTIFVAAANKAASVDMQNRLVYNILSILR